MVRQTMKPCSEAQRWVPNAASSESGKRWRILVPAIAVAGILMCPWPGTAGERAAATGLQEGPAAADSARAGEPDRAWSVMLQSLATSPESKEVLSRVGALVRQGDLEGAKQALSAAIEMGTLAVLMIDHIQDPSLGASLQAMAGEGPNPPSSPEAQQQVTSDPAQEAKIAELESALERERNRADAAQRALSTAQGQLDTLKAGEPRLAELRNALDQEKTRAASAAQELQAARDKLAALTIGEGRASELTTTLAQEKERSAAAFREVDNLRRQLTAVETASDTLRDALEQEKERAASTARELQAAREAVKAVGASETKTAELRHVAAQEKGRADAALLELGMVREQVMALTATGIKAAEIRTALAQEKERSSSLARELDAVRKQLAALKADEAKAQAQLTASKANDARALAAENALRQEREKAASARRELDSLKAQLAALGNRTDSIPSSVMFRLIAPDAPEMSTPGNDVRRPSQDNKEDDATRRKDRQSRLPTETAAPPARPKETIGAPSPSQARRAPQAETRVEKLTSEARGQSAAPERKATAKASRPAARTLARDGDDDMPARALELPIELLPSTEHWQFE